MENLLKKHAEKGRFIIVGLINTAIDFGILFTLVNLGLPTIISNFVSTSIALLFSFFANKTFTFKGADKGTGRHFVYFLVITLSGLWIIQPIIIEGTQLLIGSWITNKNITLLVGKLLATCVTLVWNYLLYRKFVFKKRP
jgi:putative flippase GtrA